MTEAVKERTASATSKPTAIDSRLEVVVIPVSDVDRAKAFYASLGWRLDADFAGEGWRVIQFTPPGSATSIIFGKNVTPASPGSAQGLYLVVSDVEAARKDLQDRGVKVSEAFHAAGDVHVGKDEPYLFGSLRRNGRDPARGSYLSYASFSDPDGNGWLFQEVTTRLPGRMQGNTTFGSQSELAAALRRAAVAHGEHEKRNGGQHDANWPDWYAEYIVREQAGEQLPV